MESSSGCPMLPARERQDLGQVSQEPKNIFCSKLYVLVLLQKTPSGVAQWRWLTSSVQIPITRYIKIDVLQAEDSF